MAELLKGVTYSPGDVVDATGLNNLVDAATALKGIVMDQPSATPVAADDSILFHDATTNDLARCKISAVPTGVTSVSATATPTSVFGVTVGTPTSTPAIALTLDNQTPNKVLASPVSGTGQPSFRALELADLPAAVVPISLSAIDWNLGSVFTKTLTTTPVTLNFTNATSGQRILVWVQQTPAGTAVLHWSATAGVIRWPSGTEPVLTTGGNHIDVFEFFAIGTTAFYGIRWGKDMQL